MINNSVRNAALDPSQLFWEINDVTKNKEKYKINKNLQYLRIAPLSILKKVLIQYRFFTHFYITDMALLVSKLPFGKMRTILAEILYEELGNGHSEKSHPQLYDNFLLSLGIPALELNRANDYCIRNLTRIQSSLNNHSWAYGIGLRGMGGECLCQIYLSILYEFFSENPAIQAIKNSLEWTFWEIHIGEVDLHHQQMMRETLTELIIAQPDIVQDIQAGYLESNHAWDNFWEHIFKAANENESQNN